MNKFYLSQTLLKSYEEMCPLAFSKRFFGSESEQKLFNLDKEVFKRGVLFETLAIGMGLGGKTAQEGDVPRSSAFYSRIVEQASIYREWESKMGFKPIGSQQYIATKVEWDNGMYYAQGNIDRLVRDQNGTLCVIDTKLTGKLESTYGKFQFGNPNKVDTTQLLHYATIVKHKYGEDARAMYYVADSKRDFGAKVLEYKFQPWHEYAHHERCQTAYNSIVASLAIDDWQPIPASQNCSSCPLGDAEKLHGTQIELCKYKRRIPEIEVIELQ